MKLGDFSLLKEDDSHYVVGHPKGRSMKIPKKGLSSKAQSLISKLKTGQHFDEGGEVAPEEGVQDIDLPEEAPKQEIVAEPVEAPPPMPQAPQSSAGLPPAPTEVTGGTDAMTVEPLNQAGADRAPASVKPADDSPIADLSGIYKREHADIEKGAQAEAAAGREASKAYGDYAQAMQKAPSPTSLFQDYQKADAALRDSFMSQKLDPDRYMKSMSTGSKITSAIAMIMGGIGSGLTGQPNVAVQMLHNAIERDIDAQKNDQSKSMNLWKMNRERLHDETQATLATQNQMLAVAKAKAEAAGARAQGPMAQARASQLLAQIDQQMAENNQTRALLGSVSHGGMSDVDPAVLVNHLVKDPAQRQKVFGEIQAAQNTKNMGDEILKNFEQANKENTVIRTGAGMLRTPGSVYALHQAMQPTFADLEGTVRQAAMDNTFKNITPSPGDSEHTIQTKREALKHYLLSKASAPTAKGSGIDLSRFSSTAPPADNQIYYKDGLPYKKVNGGYQKVAQQKAPQK